MNEDITAKRPLSTDPEWFTQVPAGQYLTLGRMAKILRASGCTVSYLPADPALAEVIDAEVSDEATNKRVADASDYSIQLQRIIEAICHGTPLRDDSKNLFHHKMAEKFKAENHAPDASVSALIDAANAVSKAVSILSSGFPLAPELSDVEVAADQLRDAIKAITPGADGRFCTHHNDDPAHGDECYAARDASEAERPNGGLDMRRGE